MDPVLSLQQSAATESAPAAPRIGILVVAYNAESTLASVLDRVPPLFRDRVDQVLVCDDASPDSTYLVGLGYQQLKQDLPLTVMRHPKNLGYGGNQKAGYRMAIDRGFDIVVLLHADGQYAPECLPEIVAPLERGECDAVMGSRMIVPGAARAGGMPLYKYLGNRLLTAFQNRLLGTSLSEFHSGYRAYRVAALSAIPFERNSDDFNFDTQIIIQLIDAGRKIVEVPIPTFYGDEICYVNGLKYARDIAADVVRYRLSKLGFTVGEVSGIGDERRLQPPPDDSHATILRWLRARARSRILELEAGAGGLSAQIAALGHQVSSLVIPPDDLDRGLPAAVLGEAPFDVIVAADVMEHVREPEVLLRQLHDVLAPGGVLIASVPNFGHWYARGRAALGIFDYDQRGVLDRGHVRFFTRRSLRQRLRTAGFDVIREEVTGLPLAALRAGDGALRRALGRIDRVLVALRPTLFGYQFVSMCEKSPPPEFVDPARSAQAVRYFSSNDSAAELMQ